MRDFVRNGSLVSRVRVACIGFALLALSSGVLEAQVITEFSTGITASSQPHGICAGPDGNVWFAESFGNKIGKITPSGVITEYGGLSSTFGPWAIVAGPDGNLWFTSQGQAGIGRITPAGVVTEYTAGITVPGAILGIAVGSDNNLWFTEYTASKIGRISPTTFAVTEFPIGSVVAPQGIAAGPDGNLWFTEYGNPGRIGRITTAGVITEFPAPTPGGGIEAIAAGADGNLWYADQNNGLIGRITTAGVVTEFPIGGVFPQVRGISGGSDGNVWFTEYNGAKIGRIDPTGAVTEFGSGITGNPKPRSITSGPDGSLWFTEEVGNRIGRITTGVTAPGVLYYALPPCRVLDTRNAPGPLGAPALQAAGSADRAFVAIGTCGIPGAAIALSVNVTVTTPTGSGYLSLYRGDGARTGTYSISFMAGQTRANNELVQLALDASGSFKVQNASPGTVEFILDVSGYFR